MNVSGIGTDSTTPANFIKTAIPFTAAAVTTWVLVAFQIESETLLSRLCWPINLLRQLFRKSINKSSERGVALEQISVDEAPIM